MTLQRTLWILIICTSLMAVAGGAIGLALGKFAPDYYFAVFSNIGGSIDPVSVGVGLGVSQGAMAGVIVGLGLVARFSWQEIRKSQSKPTQVANLTDRSPFPQPRTSILLHWSAWRALRIAIYSLGLILCLFIGWLAGLLMGTTGAYHRQYMIERQAMLTVLADDPAFKEIEIGELSSGGMYLLGEIDPSHVPRLRELTVQAVGQFRADEALYLFNR